MMFAPMDVSIIFPVYNPDKKLLKKIISVINHQNYKGNKEILIIDEHKGFAEQMNIGIRKSKYSLVVMLPQDCIPVGKEWLTHLLMPFADKKVVASVSQVELPSALWDTFSYGTKGIMIKEKGIIRSSLDGKGGAYRKSAMQKIGLFDERTFRTAGEDYDTYVKLKKRGKIVYPNVKIIHYHPTTFKQRLKKQYQYANGYGALVRVHGKEMVRWYVGMLKAIPLVGLITYPLSYPFNKGGLGLLPAYLFASLCDHPYYIAGFWKGFMDGKQTV
ncbi:glycosyltransferase family 2 protein [Candidatus Pacearchaeota archaeon]|nr:glycosyltransferase family 2 protein [Candidatus Pacearchaeota archaeon]